MVRPFESLDDFFSKVPDYMSEMKKELDDFLDNHMPEYVKERMKDLEELTEGMSQYKMTRLGVEEKPVDDDKYMIHLHTLDPKKVKITVEDGMLYLSRDFEREEKTEHSFSYVRMGSQRGYALPPGIKEEDIKISYGDHKLMLEFPKEVPEKEEEVLH